jgi:hypothetical protein
MAEVICGGRSIREINSDIKSRIRGGDQQITVRDPGARHNLAVAILERAHVTIEGSAGYYCGALADGSTVEVLSCMGAPETAQARPFAEARWSSMAMPPLARESRSKAAWC